MDKTRNAFSCQIEDGVAVVQFDAPGEAVNTWTKEALNDFERVLDTLEAQRDEIRGVVFISGKKTGFHAGANLKFVSEQGDISGVMDLIRELGRAFVRLEGIGITTVAAINGPALGGGFEFALPMTARLATDAPQTIIGLPECNVGLIPGAGGTQRMPRLIGYPAIGLIVKGKAVPASKALELGLIDRLVPQGEDLLAKAKAFVREIVDGSVVLKRPHHDFSDLDSVVDSERKAILRTTRGRELPAHMLVLKAMREGLRAPLEEALMVEQDTLMEVVNAPEAKGSIHSFFLKTYSDKIDGMLPKGFEPKPLNKVAVLGFGTMGRGIVIDILKGMRVPVVVKDIPDALEPGRDFVRKVFQGMADKGRLKVPVDTLCDLMRPVSEWTEDFKDVDLVIEAVFEDPLVKADVYKGLCKSVKSDCLIASNTSSMLVTELAKNITHPERFGGTHFFSPVWLMQLVEVIKGEKTSPDTINNLLNFAGAIGKRPLVCNDHPLFVVNSILFPYIIKAFELLESGVSIEDVDGAAANFGFPVGPIKLCDEVGIDVLYLVFTKSLGRKPPQTMENVVKAGRLGYKKSGKGFYLAKGGVDPDALSFIPIEETPKEYELDEIQDMLFHSLVEAGKVLLEKGVVSDPRAIDIGAVWGTGFPTDKGGPMKWADITGLSKKDYGFEFYSRFSA